MFHSVCNLWLLIVCLCDFKYSLQDESKFSSSIEVQSKLNNHDHDSIFKEIENEEMMVAEVEETSKVGLFNGSGDLEGSGELPNTKTRNDIENCIEIGFTEICSNKGKCVDNKCVCNSVEIHEDNVTSYYRYTGKYCEECPYCRAQRCHQYLPCIECNLFQKDANCNPYCQFQYEIVDKVVRDVDNDEKFCDVENSDSCFFKFKYYFNSQQSVVVQYEKEIFCFDGYKFTIYTFWGVIIYIFALTLLVPRICCVSRQEIHKSRSWSSLSRGFDVLRLQLFRK